MPVATKIDMGLQNFLVTVSEAQSVAGQKKTIADFARWRLDEADKLNRSAFGYTPKHTTTVDGREGASLESVKPDGGRIVFDFELFSELMKDAIEAAIKALRDASPVVSGAYRDGHTLYVNDVAFDEVPQALKPTDTIMVSNPVIYARRIEIGRTISGRSFVMQVPNRIYERVAKNTLAPRFGNQIKITFGYVALPDAATVTGGLQTRTPHYGIGGGKMRKRRQVVGSQVGSPAITFEALG